jgi:hypothetical protein
MVAPAIAGIDLFKIGWCPSIAWMNKARHGYLYIFAESSRLYLRKSQLNQQVCGVEAKHTRHTCETLR